MVDLGRLGVRFKRVEILPTSHTSLLRLAMATAIGMNNPSGSLARTALRAKPIVAMLLLLVALALTATNAFNFTRAVANPVISADAWYFLDVFVAKDLDGTLSWRDFFIKRNTSDHSQPVHKLILWANTRWFDLDFVFEAMVGFFGMCVCVAIFLGVGLSARAGPGRLRLADAFVLALIPMAMFSLNSMEIYSWPLVMMFLLVLPAALSLFWFSSRTSGDQWSPLLFLLAMLALLALDTGGVLACSAAIGAFVLRALLGGDLRGPLRPVACLLAAMVLYALAYRWVMPNLPAGPLQSSAAIAQALAAQSADAWKLALIPAVASVAHWDNLQYLYKDQATKYMVALGAIVLLAHALFWWSNLRHLRTSRVGFFACALMLYVYAMAFGVIVSRVPDFGVNYLWQNRYVVFFQLANVALVLQWLVHRANAEATQPSRTRALSGAAGAALVFALFGYVQLRLSEIAWFHAPFIRIYEVAMADTLHCLGDNAAQPNLVCLPNHLVCEWDAGVRQRLVGLLREHRLNVFSADIAARYGMQPHPGRENVCLPSAP